MDITRPSLRPGSIYNITDIIRQIDAYYQTNHFGSPLADLCYPGAEVEAGVALQAAGAELGRGGRALRALQ